MALYSQIVLIILLFVNNVMCEVPLVYKPHRKVYRKGLFTAVHKNYINRYSLLEKFAHLKNSSEIINISPQCRTDLDLVVINLETEDWAQTMFDAEGTLNAGILDGNTQWLGKFPECMRVHAKTGYIEPSNQTWVPRDFRGRYCKSYWNIPLPGNDSEQMAIGSCVPDSCSQDDVMSLYFQETIDFGFLPVWHTFCGPDRDFSKDAGAIVSSVIIGIFALLIVLATFYDTLVLPYLPFLKPSTKSFDLSKIEANTFVNGSYVKDAGDIAMNKMKPTIDVYQNGKASELYHGSQTKVAPAEDIGSNGNIVNSADVQKKAQPNDKINDKSNTQSAPKKPEERKPTHILGQMLQCFSLRANVPAIVSTEEGRGSIGCLNGIRFWSMMWVIFGHTYVFTNSGDVSIENRYTDDYTDKFSNQALINGPLSVDAFFLLSACLVTYIFLKVTAKQKGHITPYQMFLFYVHRYLRLTPVYMLVLMITTNFFPYVPYGPLQSGFYITEACKKTWWANLLYVNNFVKNGDWCMGHAWYLANDMQFYIISPLYLIPLALVPLSGFVIIGALFAAYVTIYAYMLNKIFTGEMAGDRYQWEIYYKPYCRIGPYLIGAVLGYILFKTKCKVKMNKFVVLIGWVVALLGMFFIVFGTAWRPYCEVCAWKTPVEITYRIMSRNGFVTCLSWVIFACATGYGGFINYFLSWKFFVPLSRLTYCGYLIHFLVMHYYFYVRYDIYYAQKLPTIYLFFGHTMVTFLAAFLISVMFEVPLGSLENLLIRKKKK